MPTATHYIVDWKHNGRVVFPDLESAEEEKAILLEADDEAKADDIVIWTKEFTQEEVDAMPEFEGW